MTEKSADCEVRDDWFLAQDVNAWTSIAYLAVALLIVVVVVRRRLPRALLALAVVTALQAVGSVLYHGGDGEIAQVLHDVPLVGALGFVAGRHAGLLSNRASVSAVAGLACGLAAGAIASALDVTNLAVAVLVVVTIAAELVARRQHRTPVLTAPLLVLVAAAAATWLAGSSDSPLCREQSWLQPHGAWHVLSALVVLAWVDAASRRRSAATGLNQGDGCERKMSRPRRRDRNSAAS